MRVEVCVTSDGVDLHRVGGHNALVTTHARSHVKGAWVVDESPWQGLATGTTSTSSAMSAPIKYEKLIASRSRHVTVLVHYCDLSLYDPGAAQ